MAPAEQVLDEVGLDGLISALAAQGYQVIGPTVAGQRHRPGRAELGGRPAGGLRGGVGPGHYRLRRRDDRSMFAHSAGPQSWKQFLHPAAAAAVVRPGGRPVRTGYRGGAAIRLPRACAAAIWPPSRSWAGSSAAGPAPTARYQRRRQHLFIVAVNCTEPGGVCFCASMGTGPGAGPGYDLALTERTEDGRHIVRRRRGHAPRARRCWPRSRTARPTRPTVSEARAGRGRRGRTTWAARCPPPTCVTCCVTARDSRSVGRGRRTLPDLRQLHDGLPDLLLHHAPRTCTDLTGEHAERWQRWASCFELDFSYLHGGSVRPVRGEPVPAVDHAQAGHLARPVRHVRAASAAGGASPGARSASTSPRR